MAMNCLLVRFEKAMFLLHNSTLKRAEKVKTQRRGLENFRVNEAISFMHIAGLEVLRAFLESASSKTKFFERAVALKPPTIEDCLSKRIIACLDVRSNDEGDLVVTKGDQYDVRERSDVENAVVRNLGKPVELAKRYYNEGADEITFLNITSFRSCPLADLPMLEVLRQASQTVFVPLTVGGGIRAISDPESGKEVSAMVCKLEHDVFCSNGYSASEQTDRRRCILSVRSR
jgi:hypothetical protein